MLRAGLGVDRISLAARREAGIQDDTQLLWTQANESSNHVLQTSIKLPADLPTFSRRLRTVVVQPAERDVASSMAGKGPWHLRRDIHTAANRSQQEHSSGVGDTELPVRRDQGVGPAHDLPVSREQDAVAADRMSDHGELSPPPSPTDDTMEVDEEDERGTEDCAQPTSSLRSALEETTNLNVSAPITSSRVTQPDPTTPQHDRRPVVPTVEPRTPMANDPGSEAPVATRDSECVSPNEQGMRSSPAAPADVTAVQDNDPVVLRLAGGSSSQYTIAVTGEALRLHKIHGDRLAVLLTVQPRVWLVALAGHNMTATYATVILERGGATCNMCDGASFCIHRAAINVVADQVLCVAPSGWTPDVDEAALRTARRLHAPGSKQHSPSRSYGPLSIGAEFARRFPPDAPSAARYLVETGGVVPANPSPLGGISAHVVQSVRRAGVWHAVLQGVCTAHTGKTRCICALAVAELGEQQGRALQPLQQPQQPVRDTLRPRQHPATGALRAHVGKQLDTTAWPSMVPNFGATCFVSASMALLGSAFSVAAGRLPAAAATPVLGALGRLATQAVRNADAMADLLRSVGMPSDNVQETQALDEFVGFLLGRLDEELGDNNTILADLRIRSIVTTIGADGKRQVQETHAAAMHVGYAPLGGRRRVPLQALLDVAEAVEHLGTTTRQERYEATGRCILVVIRRQRTNGEKIYTPVTLSDDVVVGGVRFRPRAASFHSGDGVGGHYTSIVPRSSADSSAATAKWVLADDGRTTPWPTGLRTAPAQAQAVAVILERVNPNIVASQPVTEPARTAPSQSIAPSAVTQSSAPSGQSRSTATSVPSKSARHAVLDAASDSVAAYGAPPSAVTFNDPERKSEDVSVKDSDDNGDVQVVEPDHAALVEKLIADLGHGLAQFPTGDPKNVARLCSRAVGETRGKLIASTIDSNRFTERLVLVDWLDQFLHPEVQVAVLGTESFFSVRRAPSPFVGPGGMRKVTTGSYRRPRWRALTTADGGDAHL